MDNLPAHKVAGARDAIEMLFAKLKTLLCKAAERTIASLWTTIGRLLDD